MRPDVKVEVVTFRGGARLSVVTHGRRLVSAAWGMSHTGQVTGPEQDWGAGFPGCEVVGGSSGGEARAREWLRAVGEACIEASKAEVTHAA